MNLFFSRQVATVNPSAPVSFRRPEAASAGRPDVSIDTLSLAADARKVKVADKDALVITAKAGDTYWALARRFAATTSPDGTPTPSEINAYVKDLQAANGKSSTIRIGQAIKLPTTANATWKLPALVAAQKDLGKQAAEFDWSKADAKWGYAESIDVTVPALKGGKTQAFSIREYGPTKGGSLYEVAQLKAALGPRELKVSAQEPVVIAAQAGDSYWALARRFAATVSPDGVPTPSEINAYVKDLQAANGMSLKAGQAVKLPRTERATWQLEALAAAQKDIQARMKAGEKLPAFDWAKAEVKWGYAEAMEVVFAPILGGKAESLAVHAIGPESYRVQGLAEYYRENGLAE